MRIQNTETKEIEDVNNKQAIQVIRRTEGLWVEYREPTQVVAEEKKIDVSRNSKQSPRKTTRKRRIKRKSE